MMRPLFPLFVALALVGSNTACGVDCVEFCSKVEDCNSGACKASTCESICSKQRDAGTPFGSFEDQAACVLDSSCEELDHNGCYYNTLNFGAWCGG